MAITSLPDFGADPVTITGPGLDAKVNPLATDYNGNIDNSNIASAAAIANSKLNLASISQNIAHSGTMTHSGTLTMTAKDITEAKGADVASATTTTIWVADGNFIHITGTTTITSFGTAAQAGDERTIVFDGVLTLTHNATSLILPTGANITTAAGDTAVVRAETTANARVISYNKKDGNAPIGAFTPSVTNALTGSIIQTVSTTTTGRISLNAAIPQDASKPQIGEGVQVHTRAITPNSTSNFLLIRATCVVGTASADTITAALFNTAVDANNALAVATTYVVANKTGTIVLEYYAAAPSTSANTYTVRCGSGGTDADFNGTSNGTALYNGTCASTITIQEIKG